MPESQAGNSQWEWGLLRRSPKGIKVRSLHLTVNSPNSMRDNTCQCFSRFLFLIMCDCVCLECGFGGPRKQLWATWHGCWGLNSSPLEKQESLLTARLSLQPPPINFWNGRCPNSMTITLDYPPNGWASCKQDPPQSLATLTEQDRREQNIVFLNSDSPGSLFMLTPWAESPIPMYLKKANRELMKTKWNTYVWRGHDDTHYFIC